MTDPIPACAAAGADPWSPDPSIRDIIATSLCPRCPARTACADARQDATEGVWAGVDLGVPRPISTAPKKPRPVPVGPVLEHINRLLAEGHQLGAIARAAGIPVSTLDSARKPERRRISATSARAILAVTTPAPARVAPDRTRDRISRLLDAGMTRRAIADRADVTPQTISAITLGRSKRIRTATEAAILAIPVPEEDAA